MCHLGRVAAKPLSYTKKWTVCQHEGKLIRSTENKVDNRVKTKLRHLGQQKSSVGNKMEVPWRNLGRDKMTTDSI